MNKLPQKNIKSITLFLESADLWQMYRYHFVDSTMIPMCHNMRRYANKGVSTNEKWTTGCCHGFELHLVCNDCGEIIAFCFTGANVDDRDPQIWVVLAKELYGKLFADRGYILLRLFHYFPTMGFI